MTETNQRNEIDEMNQITDDFFSRFSRAPRISRLLSEPDEPKRVAVPMSKVKTENG